MLAHLWTKGPTPKEYITLNLCRLFSCLPSDLRKENPQDLLDAMICVSAEKKAEKKR